MSHGIYTIAFGLAFYLVVKALQTTAFSILTATIARSF